MSDKNVIIPDSIKYQPHLYAFDIWMQSFFRRMDLSQILIYFVDKVNPSVLGILANEFDLLGNKGMAFAPTYPQQRDLLNKCIQLHRYKGTPWAIEQALDIVGITSGTVIEGVGTVDDSNDWLRFGVEIDTSVMVPSAGQITNATTLINVFKNKRSEFVSFTYV